MALSKSTRFHDSESGTLGKKIGFDITLQLHLNRILKLSSMIFLSDSYAESFIEAVNTLEYTLMPYAVGTDYEEKKSQIIELINKRRNSIAPHEMTPEIELKLRIEEARARYSILIQLMISKGFLPEHSIPDVV